MVYNVFIGQPTLTRFIAIPHFAYLVLKMTRSHGVISVKGDVKHTYNCDKESCETAGRIAVSVELQELTKALAKSPSDPIMPEVKTSKTSIQPEDSLSKTVPLSLDEPSKVAHVGNSLYPK
jgi:hypothetical protein